jgi:DNA repair ATPase RecN
MSADQVADLRERLARIEERQTSIIQILERHTSELAQWTGKINNKVDTLERESHTIKTKLWLVAMVAGAVCSTAWELVKARLFPSH